MYNVIQYNASISICQADTVPSRRDLAHTCKAEKQLSVRPLGSGPQLVQTTLFLGIVVESGFFFFFPGHFFLFFPAHLTLNAHTNYIAWVAVPKEPR